MNQLDRLRFRARARELCSFWQGVRSAHLNRRLLSEGRFSTLGRNDSSGFSHEASRVGVNICLPEMPLSGHVTGSANDEQSSCDSGPPKRLLENELV